ncbi:DUF2530 domain-containing protein [Microcella sp.]|uniref:DUF2530 domain-containing protein n=1 Tax=Microcella sp. TaxID=1913979 RepID=UPI003918F654
MRLWVPHDERRPQPEPLATNDRLAYLVGITLWLAAIAVIAVMALTGVMTDTVGMLVTAGIGIALGAAGLIVVSRPRR